MALVLFFICQSCRCRHKFPNAVRFLSVAYGERSVCASHADAGLKGSEWGRTQNFCVQTEASGGLKDQIRLVPACGESPVPT